MTENFNSDKLSESSLPDIVYLNNLRIHSARKKDCIQKLREQIAKYSAEEGITVGRLYMYPPQLTNSGFGVDSFPPISFYANVKTTIGCILGGVDLEGMIKHEAYHIKNYFGALTKLENLSEIRIALQRYVPFLETVPDAIGEIIMTLEFGSLSHLHQNLLDYEKFLLSSAKTLKKHTAVIHASPEELATFIEENDKKFNNCKMALSYVLDSPDFYSGLHIIPACDDDSLSIRRQAANKPLAEKDSKSYKELLPVIKRVLAAQEQSGLEDFLTNTRKAIEYAADSYAYQHSENKDSLPEFLKWMGAYEVKKRRIPRETVYNYDDGVHPSLENRLTRLSEKAKKDGLSK